MKKSKLTVAKLQYCCRSDSEYSILKSSTGNSAARSLHSIEKVLMFTYLVIISQQQINPRTAASKDEPIFSIPV